MTFMMKTIGADDTEVIIKRTQEQLLQAQEVVLENLENQQAVLEELKADRDKHKEAIATFTDDVNKINLFSIKVTNKIKRIEAIQKQTGTSCFLIENKTTSQEIKSLLSNIERGLKTTKSRAHAQFLETIKETADTCKEFIANNTPFADQYIPMLDSEKPYASQLLVNQKLDLLASYSTEHAAWFNDIRDIYNQAADTKGFAGLLGYESAFLKSVRTSIAEIVQNHPVIPENSKDLISKVQSSTEKLFAALDANQSYSYSFKKFVNHLCNKIKIVPPVFMVTEKKEEMLQRFKQMKAEVRERRPVEKAEQPAAGNDDASPGNKT